MTKSPPPTDRPVFLERRSYRSRRMMDAVRLLPFLGIALWMVPMLWPMTSAPDLPGGTRMSAALRYVFGIWLVMVLASAALWARTKGDPRTGTKPPRAPD